MVLDLEINTCSSKFSFGKVDLYSHTHFYSIHMQNSIFISICITSSASCNNVKAHKRCTRSLSQVNIKTTSETKPQQHVNQDMLILHKVT